MALGDGYARITVSNMNVNWNTSFSPIMTTVSPPVTYTFPNTSWTEASVPFAVDYTAFQPVDDHVFEPVEDEIFPNVQRCRHCAYNNPQKYDAGAHMFVIEEELDFLALMELLAA